MTLASRTFCSRFVLTTYIVYFMVGVTAHLSALLSLNKAHKGPSFEGNATCYDFLPYFFLIPFDSESTRGCKNALIFMDLGLGVLGSYVASCDTLFCILLVSMKTNLKILSEATRSIRNRTLVKMGLPVDFKVLRDEDFPQYEQALYSELKKCNLHLATLIRINEDIERIFSLVILLQTVTLVFMMASNIFIASLLSFSDPEMYSLIENCLAALIQLSMSCYFGSSITEAKKSI
ncbi:unnamed protein product [Acanthoscelides obtectus]|uniref:Uncharacterized protein n=1 Tax=Acanthoscelides obtectus TaxID=200917 RepID=A0A9P0KMW8_ACAOB|nr:unnamed protein product [Acanthoscelides obtectus]CAK1631850.1 hypothetical protein AOBTE_LOCUS7201 [Acanthoscelides obtectus]